MKKLAILIAMSAMSICLISAGTLALKESRQDSLIPDPLSRTVTGTVTYVENDTLKPLPGVNVEIKGTSYGTATDIEGKYSISVPDWSILLVFSTVICQSQEVPTENKTVIDVTLHCDGSDE